MPQSPDHLDSLIAPLVEDDPIIREKASKLVHTALDRAMDMLMRGDTTQQMTMIKTLLPSVFKASHNSANEEAAQLRRDFDTLRDEFRQGLFSPRAATGTTNVAPFRRVPRAGSS